MEGKAQSKGSEGARRNETLRNRRVVRCAMPPLLQWLGAGGLCTVLCTELLEDIPNAIKR